MKNNKVDFAIIGAGPGGIALALYLKHANKNFILFEKNAPGGKLNHIANVRNYLGYKNIDGPTLAYKFFEQISSLGIEIINEEVINIKKENDCFTILTNTSSYIAKIVIIATGIEPIKSKAINFDKLFHKGISSCAICDGNLYKNKTIALIGHNYIANEEYNYLKNIAKEIIRIDNKQEKVIEYIGKDKLEKIKTNKNIYDVVAAFVYDKENLNTAFLNNFLIKKRNNRLLVNKNYETNIKHLYAIGDAIYKPIYQIIGAINDASVVSSIIIKELKNEKR